MRSLFNWGASSVAGGETNNEPLPREIHDSDSEAYFTGVYPARLALRARMAGRPACRSEADLSAGTMVEIYPPELWRIYPPLEGSAIGALLQAIG